MNKNEARALLEKKLGWFDKELLDHYELKAQREIEQGINVEENKEILSLIKTLCEPTKCGLDRKVIKDNRKHVIDCESLFGSKY